MKDLDWKPYLRDRLIAEHPAGFSIIKPKDQRAGTPLFCPLCDTMMTSYYDEGSYRKFQCCDACASKWAYPNQDKWKDGWRPANEEVTEVIKSRFTAQDIHS